MLRTERSRITVMLTAFLLLALCLTGLMLFTACGGGGSSTSGSQPSSGTGTLVLKANLSGTVPANTDIAGISFSLNIPVSALSVRDANGSLSVDLVRPSGIFQDGMLLPLQYRLSKDEASADLQIVLVHTATQGTRQTGELATISLSSAFGATLSAADCTLTNPVVIDLTGRPIPGLSIFLAR